MEASLRGDEGVVLEWQLCGVGRVSCGGLERKPKIKNPKAGVSLHFLFHGGGAAVPGFLKGGGCREDESLGLGFFLLLFQRKGAARLV